MPRQTRSEHSDFDGKRVVVTRSGISNEAGKSFCAGPQGQVPDTGEFNDLASSLKPAPKTGCPF